MHKMFQSQMTKPVWQRQRMTSFARGVPAPLLSHMPPQLKCERVAHVSRNPLGALLTCKHVEDENKTELLGYMQLLCVEKKATLHITLEF